MGRIKEGVQFTAMPDLVKQTAKELDLYEDDIKMIVDKYFENATECLIHASEEYPVEVHLCSGLKLISTFVPAHIHEHPRTKEPILVPDKLSFRAKFTSHFVWTTNAVFLETRKLWNDYVNKNKSKGANLYGYSDIRLSAKMLEEVKKNNKTKRGQKMSLDKCIHIDDVSEEVEEIIFEDVVEVVSESVSEVSEVASEVETI